MSADQRPPFTLPALLGGCTCRPLRWRRGLPAVLALALAAAAAPVPAAPADVTAAAVRPERARLDRLARDTKIQHPAALLADLENGAPTTRVIVTLAPTPDAEALAARSVTLEARPEVFERPDAPPFFALRNRAVRAELRQGVTARVDQAVGQHAGPGLTVTQRFSYQFGYAAQVTDAALERLIADPEVVRVEPDRTLAPHLAQGLPLMSAAGPRTAYDGSGVSIAICDTGIDTSHPRLGGTGNRATDPIFNAKVLGGYDTGDDDADPRPAADGQPHGTACAGIAAGNTGTVGDYIGGVAPGARLYAIKIAVGKGGTAYDSAMIAGWEWAITHQYDDPDNPILIISTSFGGGAFSDTATCDADTPAMTTAAANAVAAGITLFASSGNDGYCGSIAWPACISYVNSVGAVADANLGVISWCLASASCAPKASGGCASGAYATGPTLYDQVTPYSNSASILTLLAPSNDASTTDIVGSGGYTSGDYYAYFGGTSAASPYAAGAAAVLQAAAKARTGAFLTPAQVRQSLTEHGDPVTDTKFAVTKPRIDLTQSVEAVPLTTFAIATAAIPAAGGGVGCTPNPVALGGSSACTATANPGYHFASWDGDCAGQTGSTCTLTKVTASRSVTAHFSDRYTLTTAVSPASAGLIAPSPGGDHAEGASVTVTVYPVVGYGVASWTQDGLTTPSTANAWPVTMSGAHSVTANLRAGLPVLTAAVTARTGSVGATRTWTLSLTNRTTATAAAAAARFDALTLTQTYPATNKCSPVIGTLPTLGTLAVGATGTGTVAIDFSGCLATARFAAKLDYSDGGSAADSKTLNNQFQ